MRRNSGGWRALVVAAVVATSLSGTVRTARAEESFGRTVGLGAGAAFTNLLYMPAKLVYATLGGVTGGLAYLLTIGNLEVANAVWRPSLGGTYVVTPKMLAGEDQIHFSGSVEDDDGRQVESGDRDPRRDGY
jgi:hypothetical protein